MPPVESLNPDESLWDWIASELRFLREKEGLSLSQLGEVIGAQKQTVSNVEHARTGWRLNEDQAKKLDEVFCLNGTFRRLLRYAKADRNEAWYQEWLTYAQRALSMRIYEALLIPGLFQTAGYATALFEACRNVPDVDVAVQTRMRRQEIITRKDPPRVWATVHENALDQPIGSDEVMREQLSALLSLPRNVTIRVVPRSAGAHPGIDGSFFLMATADEEVAYFESCGARKVERGKMQVRSYTERMEAINSVALPVKESAALISSKLERVR